MCSFGGYVSFNNLRKENTFFVFCYLDFVDNKIKFQQWSSHYIIDKYHNNPYSDSCSLALVGKLE